MDKKKESIERARPQKVISNIARKGEKEKKTNISMPKEIGDFSIGGMGESREREESFKKLSFDLESRLKSRTNELVKSNLELEKTMHVLRQSEERYRTLFETSNDAISITTRDGKYITYNQSFLDLFGYTDADMIDITAQEKYLDSNDRKRFQREVEEKGSVQDFEVRLKKKNGDKLHCLMTATLRRAHDGSILGYQGIIRDITQQKQAEEALRESEAQKKAILDASIDRIRLVDRDLRILWTNKTAARELKVQPKDLIGQYCYRVYAGRDTICEECPTVKAFTSGRIQHAILHKLSSTCFEEDTYWDNYSVPIKNESGDVVHCVQVNRNITESRKAEIEKKKLEAQLQQAQKMETLGTLVSGMAHEINNPINLIMFNLPLLQKVWYDLLPILKEHAGKEPYKKYGGLTYDFLHENLNTLLLDMKMASDRVAKIVSDLKTFSMQSNMLEIQPIRIEKVLENAIRLAQVAIRESEIELELDVAPDLPMIEGNFQGIEQIVLNLIINAIQAIDRNQGKVAITTRFQKRSKRIVLTISDNGRGIDPTISDKIFDPFFTNKQAEGGTGLGLSITYNLVKAYEGEITFKSKKGKGTTFIVSFPTIKSRKMQKILVVDDDKEVRDLITEVLAREKIYHVEEAANGFDACIKLGSFHPDLLLLDIFMPEMDGLEVLRTIQMEPDLSDMQVLITTGFPDHQKWREVVEMGFTNIYRKPIKVRDILKRVETVLNRESQV